MASMELFDNVDVFHLDVVGMRSFVWMTVH